MEMYTIGLDIGSSGVKSTVFDINANRISSSYREYDLCCIEEQTYTLSPREVLNKCKEVLKEAAEKSGAADRIKAISISSIGEAFVCLDTHEEPLFEIMLYMDRRGTEECTELCSIMERRDIYNVTGCYVDPMYALYKLRWLSKHHSEITSNMRRICFVADYIAFKLGAGHFCEYSLAARSGMLSITEKKWWQEGLDFASVKIEQMPELVSTGSVVGAVSLEAAKSLGGIQKGTKLILGGHDQIMTVIGSGANKPGHLVNGIGTVDCLTGIVDSHVNKEELLRCNMPLVPLLDTPFYATYAFNMSGGINNKWFRSELAKDLKQNADAYKQLNEEIPEQPSDLLYLPYLCGGGTPAMDSITPAVIAGIRLGTSRGEMFRAFLEGTTYEMKKNLECFRKASVAIKEIMAVGGGTSSNLWMQIRSNVFEREIRLPVFGEAGTLANAILCYTALGAFKTIEEAQKEMVRYRETYCPQENQVKAYKKRFEQYQKFYQVMKEFYETDG